MLKVIEIQLLGSNLLLGCERVAIIRTPSSNSIDHTNPAAHRASQGCLATAHHTYPKGILPTALACVTIARTRALAEDALEEFSLSTFTRNCHKRLPQLLFQLPEKALFLSFTHENPCVRLSLRCNCRESDLRSTNSQCIAVKRANESNVWHNLSVDRCRWHVDVLQTMSAKCFTTIQGDCAALMLLRKTVTFERILFERSGQWYGHLISLNRWDPARYFKIIQKI